MKRQSNGILITLCIWLLIILSSPYLLTKAMVLPFILLNVFTILLSVLTSSAISFVIVISLSLLSGFGLTAYSFFYAQSFTTQIAFIKLLIMLSLSTMVIWAVYDQLKKMVSLNKRIVSKVKELEKFDRIPNLLSLNEFLNQVTIVTTSSQRKKEQCFLIEIRTLSRTHSQQSVTFTLAYLALQTVRVNFDFVCRFEDHTLFLFLQNTTMEGVDIVLDRYRQKGLAHFSVIQPPYLLQSTPISSMDDLEQFFRSKGVQI